jgi:sugar phosphate isomerase/epimerase
VTPVDVGRDLALNPLSVAGFSLDDQLAFTVELGLGLVSFSTAAVDAAGGTAHVAGRVATAGLGVAVVYPGVSVDLSRPETWPAARAGLVDAVATAVALGAGGVLVGGGAAHGMPFAAAVAAFATVIGPVRERADAAGVGLWLEPVRPQFAYAGFLHSLRDAVPVAAGLGLGLAVDVTHCWWEPAIDELLVEVAPNVGVAHLADLPLDGPAVARLVPGDGELPLRRFVDALAAGGFVGPYELEVIGPAIDAEGAHGALRRSVEYIRTLADV